MIIRYISLLLFSGLILPFYNTTSLKIQPVNSFFRFEKVKAVATYISDDITANGFSFFKDIADDLFPVLKNLNQM